MYSQLLEQMHKESLDHTNQMNNLVQETMRLKEEAAKVRSSQQLYTDTLEARLCQHGDAVEQLKHSPASSQNSGTLCIPSAIKALLDIYDELDDESKKALLSSAISINIAQLQ